MALLLAANSRTGNYFTETRPDMDSIFLATLALIVLHYGTIIARHGETVPEAPDDEEVFIRCGRDSGRRPELVPCLGILLLMSLVPSGCGETARMGGLVGQLSNALATLIQLD
jgi:hypothetical protein